MMNWTAQIWWTATNSPGDNKSKSEEKSDKVNEEFDFIFQVRVDIAGKINKLSHEEEAPKRLTKNR